MQATKVQRIAYSREGLPVFLEGGEGGVFVGCEVEDAIKACEGEDTFIVDGEATENQTMLTDTQEIVQFYEIIDAYGGYHFDVGKVNYYVRIFFCSAQFDEGVKLAD